MNATWSQLAACCLGVPHAPIRRYIRLDGVLGLVLYFFDFCEFPPIFSFSQIGNNLENGWAVWLGLSLFGPKRP